MAFTENFRQIEFNPDKEIYDTFRATQGDTKSQGFNVVVFLGGKKKVITTETMSFFAQKPDGTRVIDTAVKDGDGFKIELKNQVFAVPGVVVCTLVLNGASGEKLADRQFKILVSGSMEDGAIISKDERGILDWAFDLATDIVPRLEGLDVPLLENVDSEIILARGTEPTLGARLDADKAEVSVQLAEIENKVEDIDTKINFEKSTLVNLEDGKFVNFTGNWSRGAGAVFDVVDEILNLQITTSTAIRNNYRLASKELTVVPENLYYLSVDVFVPKQNTTVVLMIGDTATGFLPIEHSKWQNVKAILKATSNVAFSIYVNTLGLDIGDVIQYRNPMKIDLTTPFGANNEPTIEQIGLALKDKYITTEDVPIPIFENKYYGMKNGNIDFLPTKDLTSHLYGKKMVCFGDSITGKELSDDYPSVIAKRTGMEVYNVGFGGTRAGYHGSADYDRYSLYRLVDYIISGDFSPLDIAFAKPTAFPIREATLKSIDFNEVDYISIAYGANDWGGNIPSEGATPEDVTSFRGALRVSLRKLLEAYPHLKVLIISPFYRWFPDNNPVNDSDTELREGVLLYELVEASKEIAKEFKMPWLNAYDELGINRYNRLLYFSPTDGTHHIETGRELIGNKIASTILTVY